MRRDRTLIRRPAKTFGPWVAHCEQCDHVMLAHTFDGIGLNVRLHRVDRHRPAHPAPRRPGSTVALEAPARLFAYLLTGPVREAGARTAAVMRPDRRPPSWSLRSTD